MNYRDIDDLVKSMTNVAPEQKVLVAQLFAFGLGNWDGKGLLLIPLHLFDKIPNGMVLTSISGEKKTKGKDYIDDDTRGGMLAYGILPDQYQAVFDILDE